MLDFPRELVETYTPIKLLGEGGMGTVVLAQEASLERLVAVKLARLEGEGEAKARDRFLREAQALSAIRHTNILEVYNFGVTESGDAFLVMEYLEGRTLDRLAPLDDPLAPMLQIASALEALHRRRLVHRDVKGNNIVVLPDGRAVLVDFGLVHDPNRTHITRTGKVVGTISHISPEAIAGAPPTPAADWYAWGVTLFEAAEGRTPYTTDEAIARLNGQELPPPEFHWLAPGGPLARVILAAMDHDPNARPRSVHSVRRILDASASPPGASTMRRRMSLEAEQPKPREKRGGGMFAVVALMSLSLAAGWMTSADPEPGSDGGPVMHSPELSELTRGHEEELERLHPQLAPRSGVRDRLLEISFHPLERSRRHRGELISSRIFEDQTFHSRWESYLRALGDWWLATRRWGADRPDPFREMSARRVLARHHFGLALSVLADYQALDDEGRLEAIWRLDPEEARRRPGRSELTTFLEFFRETCQGFLDRGELWKPARSEPLLDVFRVLLSSHLGNNLSGDAALLESLVRRFAEAPPTWETYWTGKAALIMLATNPSEEVMPWQTRRAAVAAMQSRLFLEEDWPEPEMHLRLLGKCLSELLRLYRLRDQEGARVLKPEELTRLLDKLQARKEQSPALVREAAWQVHRVAAVQGHVYYSNAPHPEELNGVAARVEELAGIQ